MHEVFPKARFRDCIQMTEKAGHESRLRVMRKEWIDGTKARQVVPPEPIDWDALQALADAEKAREGIIAGDAGVENGDAGTVGDEEVLVLGVEEEPLFVDDGSDIDMDELLQGTQKSTDEGMTAERNVGKEVGRDDFEDEMAALNDVDFDM